MLRRLHDLDRNITHINEIQVFSSTFIPEELGINNDTRVLGIDISTIEIQ